MLDDGGKQGFRHGAMKTNFFGDCKAGNVLKISNHGLNSASGITRCRDAPDEFFRRAGQAGHDGTGRGNFQPVNERLRLGDCELLAQAVGKWRP